MRASASSPPNGSSVACDPCHDRGTVFDRASQVLLALATLMAAAFAGAPACVAARARATRTYSLSETGHLHRTSGRGITINQDLNEQGSASGTIPGTIYIHLRVVSTNRVTAEVNIYPSGGSITGSAGASYRSA